MGLERQAGHSSSSRRLAMAAVLAGATAVAAFVIPPAGAQAPEEGALVYANAGCSGCHGANGEGGIGPALAGNTDLANGAAVLAQIIHGGGGMPPFGHLPDEQIAAVANHIRTSWGNTTMITVEAVAAARAAPAPAAAP